MPAFTEANRTLATVSRLYFPKKYFFLCMEKLQNQICGLKYVNYLHPALWSQKAVCAAHTTLCFLFNADVIFLLRKFTLCSYVDKMLSLQPLTMLVILQTEQVSRQQCWLSYFCVCKTGCYFFFSWGGCGGLFPQWTDQWVFLLLQPHLGMEASLSHP